MEDNESRVTSKIKNASIGAVFNGDAEVKNLVLNLASQPAPEEETLEELKEARERLRDLLNRTRFRNAAVSGVLSFCLLAAMSYFARHFPPTASMGELLAMLMVLATIPAGLWLTCPPEWKEHIKNAKRRIKIITAKIEQIEDQIAHLEINALSARRNSRS